MASRGEDRAQRGREEQMSVPAKGSRISERAEQPAAELVLGIDATSPARILRHPSIRALRRGPVRRHRLSERFFDTAEGDFARQGFVVRIGQKARHWQQTLEPLRPKIGLAAGVVPPAASLRKGAPDLARLAAACKVLGLDVPAKDLELAFERRSETTELLLEMTDQSQLLVQLRVGESTLGSRSHAFSELTLGHLAGDAERLFDVALELAKTLPLTLLPWSSVGQGLELGAGTHQLHAEHRPADTPSPKTPRSALKALSELGQSAQQELVRTAPQTVRGTDPEDIHRTRLLLRQMRLALDWLARTGSPGRYASVGEALGQFYQSLGRARDWTVFAEHLASDSMNPAQSASRPYWTEAARTHRDAECEEARKRLGMPAFTGLMIEVAREFARAGLETSARDERWLARRFAKRLAKDDLALRRSLKDLPERPEREQHTARRLARKMRDEVQLLVSIGHSRGEKRYRDQLARLQGALGELNDWARARALAEQIHTDDGALLAVWIETARRKALARAGRAALRFEKQDEAKTLSAKRKG